MTAATVTHIANIPLAELIAETKPGFAIGDRSSDGVFQIRMNNVDTDGELDLKDMIRVPGTAKQIADCSLRSGDVLFNNTNSTELVGKSALFNGCDKPVTFSNHFTRLRTIPARLEPRYFARWLTRMHQSRVFEGLCTRWVGQSAVKAEKLLQLKIPIPFPEDHEQSVAEQQRIADILDKADAIRRKRREALTALRSLRWSLFDEWFTPWFAPDAEASRVPVSHFVKRFEGGLNIATPESPSSDTRHFILKVSAVTWGDYRPNECKPLYPDYDPPKEHFVRKGDLLFSRANTTELVGATVYVDETPSNRVLPDKLWRFVWVDDTKAEPLFVWALFNHPQIRYEIGRRATGTSGSMKNISMDKVMSIRVPWPDLDVQRKFATFQRTERNVGRAMQSALDLSTSAFNSLAQRAFRGELK